MIVTSITGTYTITSTGNVCEFYTKKRNLQ